MSAIMALMFAPLALAEVIGQPVDKGIALQPAATQIRADQIWFHNTILLPIIIAISLLVLALLPDLRRALQPQVQSDAGALEPQHAGRDRVGPSAPCSS